MKLSHFFIDRPIFAAVVAIFITLIGGFSYFALPVAQYPEVAPPTVVVKTTYPGASAQVVSESVATPLEQQINGVENMLYMVSQATGDGNLTLTITFKLGTDLDIAQVLVQNRVSIALSQLPQDVVREGVTVKKNSPDMLMVIHLISPDGSRDQLYISNYATLQIKDVLARLEGVGDVVIFGARDYAMRIWVNPNKIAARRLTAGDIVAAIRAQNVQVASGVLDQPPMANQGDFQLNVQTLGRLIEPRQFANIVINTDSNGRVTRLGDVARVELAAQDYGVNGYLDSGTAVPLGIFQQPGTNALDTAHRLEATMAELSKSFPTGIEYRIIYNPTEFIAESVNEVIKTIYEAAGLVVIVVLLFLQTWRASIIPIIAIPVSLIGTFAFLEALGFSLNNLSLFGLVLAIGIVVDDAIVVVENVERNLREGMTPRDAAHKTMDEVGGALVAIALVLAAVFIPAAFITGISGQFFRQFAVTIAAATEHLAAGLPDAQPRPLRDPLEAPCRRAAARDPAAAPAARLLPRLQLGLRQGRPWLWRADPRLRPLRGGRAARLCRAGRPHRLAVRPRAHRLHPGSRIRAMSSPSSSCRPGRPWRAPMRSSAAPPRSSSAPRAWPMRCPSPASTAPPSPMRPTPAPSSRS